MILTKKQSGIFLAFITAVFILPGCNNSKSNQTEKPNVLIIFMDDMGYGDISCYNNDATPTPNIDKLAEEGVLCTDFYVPTPYCAPSRATLLTGRFPLRNKLTRNPTPDVGIHDVGIRDSEVMLGEVFQENDYATSLIGKWHLGHKPEFFPVKHGFDEYYGILYSNDMRPVQMVENMDTVMYPVDQAILTSTFTKKAIDFIQRNAENPFFLHLCHAMPHKPLAASDDFYTPETPDDLYADVIREIDWSVEQVINELKKQEILDKTIVIFLSDNGATYGGSVMPLKGRKHRIWEGGIRVPFIIRYPNVFEGGGKINTPCWSPDIFPTILSLTDINYPEGVKLDGEDITDILLGQKTEHPPIFSLRGEEIRTVRKGDWKLFLQKPYFYKQPNLETWKDKRAPDGTTIIAPFEQATPADYPGIKPEQLPGDKYLFNLSDDISEMKNRYDENPEIVKELEESYHSFIQSLEK